MRWRDVWILFVRETRAALRERTIVVNSILLPLLLYPFMMWAMITGISFVRGQTEGFTARTVVLGLPAEHPELARLLEDDKGIALQQPGDDLAELHRRIRDGELDALLEFSPAAGAEAAVAGNFTATLTFNESRERSAQARQRLQGVLDRYREEWLEREGAALGIDPESWQGFVVQGRNVASGRELGAFLLGLMLPMFFVIMVAVGCFYPAVDATAGERERGTWETTMSLATSRGAVITAKYLHVTAFGFAAGMINLAVMTLTMGRIFGPLLGEEGGDIQFAIPLAAVPVLVLAALLLAGFVAAGMLLFAAFARTFKEGQAMITPFYMLVFIPVFFLNVPGVEFSVILALIPVANVAMVVRSAVAGSFPLLQIAVTATGSVAVIVACVALATVILRFEDVVVGSYSGSLGTFVKQRLLGKRRGPAGAAEGV